MTRVIVKSGVCGFISTVEADKVADERVKVVITSSCKMVTEMSKSLPEIAQSEIFAPHIDTEVYKCASRCKLHTTCPVPMAVLKSIEAALELALPRDVVMLFDSRI